MGDVTKYTDEGIKLAMQYAPRLVLALLTLIVGFIIVGILTRGLKRYFRSKDFDPSLESFAASFINVTLKVLIVISVAGMIGVEMTSFIAVLGAAGLAVGMALSGTLQNFAGSVVILLFRPFKVGDFIEAAGFSGTVAEIQIFNTILKTGDNKTIIIPNGQLSSSSLVNFSTESTRRVDLVFGIGYGDDIDAAKGVINRIVSADARVLEDPPVFIAVSELADSSVNFVLRAWVNASDYWGVYFNTLEAVKKEFDKEGISIPFPQQELHLHGVPPELKQLANG